MTITWEALIAICAALTVVAGGMAAYVNYAVRSALLNFESRFFERLNGRYIRREVCEERHGACRNEIDRRLVTIEGKP